jgi:protein TonB
VALALHVTALGLASHRTIPVGPDIVEFTLQPTSFPPAEPEPVGRTAPLAPVVIVDPTSIPVPVPDVPDIPLSELQARLAIDSGVPGQSIAPTLESDPDVYQLSDVQEPPELLTAPMLRYPEPLRRAGVEGGVVVAAVVDTTGRAEPGSARIVRSDDPGFDQAALAMVRGARFRPARVLGRGVRVLVWIPVQFRFDRASGSP